MESRARVRARTRAKEGATTVKRENGERRENTFLYSMKEEEREREREKAVLECRGEDTV